MYIEIVRSTNPYRLRVLKNKVFLFVPGNKRYRVRLEEGKLLLIPSETSGGKRKIRVMEKILEIFPDNYSFTPVFNEDGTIELT